jgi:hypothetical protein
MLRIALLYLILCITAILPVLSASDDSYGPHGRYGQPCGRHTEVEQRPTTCGSHGHQQFIASRARQVCSKDHDDELTYVTCLKQTIIPDVRVRRHHAHVDRNIEEAIGGARSAPTKIHLVTGPDGLR